MCKKELSEDIMRKYFNRIRKLLCGSITDNIKGLIFLIVAVVAYIAGGFN